MGMDLAPRNKGIAAVHFNWTGWGVLADLLDDLECDIDLLSGSNDGNYVTAQVARDFGRALLSALNQGKIKSVFVKDAAYFGGGYQRLTTADQGDKISLENEEWLRDIGYFFKNCNGFRQY